MYISITFLLRWQPPRKTNHGVKLLRKMRTACFLTLGNFVIPCVVQLVLIILVLIGPVKGQSDTRWFYQCSFLMIINGYITIVGVGLATVWAEATDWGIREGVSWERIATVKV
ncbi:hypothetical protein C8R46DRAFT_1105060 [Mycena filopes]|nr:hypothetical protein C8R46DRAFT_1105060 [Mycena filopes]